MPLGSDLTPFFNAAHFAVPVVMGAVSGLGILDTPGDILHDGDILSVDYVLLCEAAKFGGAQYGASLTVDGAAYTVRYVKPVDDGALVELILTKV